MLDDIEKTNYDYYVAETENSSGCCRRLWNEFVQHPFTLLEINGRVLDVQRTFANHPTWLVLPLKAVALGVALDTMVRELVMEYDNDDDDDKSFFYFAYFSHWALVLTIIYFILSLLISLTCGTWAKQPTAIHNRTSCVVTMAWTFYVLAIAYQGLNMLGYWILVHDYGDNTEWRDVNNVLTEVSYFTIMKNAGLCFILLGEGQILNRIPLRFAHLVLMEFGFCLYVGWTYLHHLTEIGNPDSPEGDQIYYFINWSDPQEIPNTAFGCAITMLVVLPVMFLFLQLLSWPCRRYMPLVEPTANGDEEEGLYAQQQGQEGEEEEELPPLMDDVLEIPLPPGKVGIMLKHSPPQVYKMSPNSPLQDTGVQEGMVIDTLTLPDGTTFYNPMSSEELTGLLMDTAGEAGRVLRFISPQMSVTEEPPEIPDELELELPSGSIGLVFHKTGPPPVLKSIKETSPLKEMYPELQPGMVVDTLTLDDGTTHYELNTKELTSLLKEHRHAEGRVMVVRHPDQPLTPNPGDGDDDDDGGDVYGGGEEDGADDDNDNDDDNMPDEVLVELPPGPMMVMLEGMPPVVTKMARESPLRDFGVVEGMAVDTLELPNGEVHYELATPDCKVKLAEHADSDGRVVRFINLDVLPLTKAPMTVREVTTAPMMEAFEEVDETEEEVRENLVGMGFDMEAIDEAIEYYKNVGEPLDADTCMTRIITQ